MKNNEVLQFKELFPLKGNITQEIIDLADIHDINNCIGARTLKLALPKKYHKYVGWGDQRGFMRLNDDSAFYVETNLNIGLMDVKEPLSIIFNLEEIDY